MILADLSFDTLLRYSTDQQISASAKAALQGAVERKLAVDEAQTVLTELSGRRAIQIAEQDRIRRNLEAAGNTSPQGQNYLARLTVLDNEIDTLREQIGEATLRVQAAKNAYARYVGELEL
jgi:flagellar biosynthesis chaperone FliJ